jgi:hypothetical protein
MTIADIEQVLRQLCDREDIVVSAMSVQSTLLFDSFSQPPRTVISTDFVTQQESSPSIQQLYATKIQQPYYQTLLVANPEIKAFSTAPLSLFIDTYRRLGRFPAVLLIDILAVDGENKAISIPPLRVHWRP